MECTGSLWRVPQASGNATSHVDGGQLFVTVLAAVGSVEAFSFSLASSTSCTNLPPTSSEEIMLSLSTDVSSITNVSLTLNNSSCVADDLVTGSGCNYLLPTVVAAVLTFLTTIISSMGFLVILVYVKTAKHRRTPRKNYHIERIGSVRIEDEETFSSVRNEEEEKSSKVIVEKFEEDPEEIINTDVGIEPDSEERRGSVARESARKKLRNILENLKLGFQSITFLRESHPEQIPVIHFTVCLIGGEECFETFKEEVQKNPLQFVERIEQILAVNVRVAINNSDTKKAEDKISRLLYDLNLMDESEVTFHSIEPVDARKGVFTTEQKFNVRLPSNTFEIFKQELEKDQQVGLVELGTWDISTFKVVVSIQSKHFLVRDTKWIIEDVLRDYGIEGRILYHEKFNIGVTKYLHKFQVELSGDQDTFEVFKDLLEKQAKNVASVTVDYLL